MLDLARHIIDTKRGTFDPAEFEDRYEAALAELVAAKAEGRAIETRKERRSEKVIDLMEALRESAKAAGKAASSRKTAAKSRRTAEPRRKAG